MKKAKNLIVTFLLCLMVLPMGVFAKESLNLPDTINDEGLTPAFSSYSENDNQAIVYLFRGKGCGYCHSFLEFINNITAEYGQYFKLVSYEVWYNEKNSNLLTTVSNYLGQPAGGVPYIVIGDQVFAGYSSAYDDSIKSAIKEMYDTPVSERYDVMKKIDEEGYVYVPTDTTGDDSSYSGDSAISINDSTESSDVVWTFIFVAMGTGAVIVYDYKKYSKLQEELQEIKQKIKK